ncbi:MAG: L,D-transpeptidase family protein, partial [Hyphomicrobiaceae bacterium]
DQSLTVWDQSGPVLKSRVSTGQAGYATPTGLFSVIEKDRHHESNIYSGAPMPWMHRITWSGIALHGGIVPNYPASHGCIRLPYDVAPQLWGMSRIGMRVVVSPSEVELLMVEHDGLPQPKLISLAGLDDTLRSERGERGEVARVVLASTEPDRLLNPLEVAHRLKKHLASAVETKRSAAREALAHSVEASAEANAAADELRAARAEVAAAEAAARALVVSLSAKSPASETAEEMALAKAAEDRVLAAYQRRQRAVAADATKDPAAYAAARAAREAEIAADEAPQQARDAARRTEPVSVFVSVKEGMIFVRQGFEQVLDTKVEIDDPLEPLGTHVFTAMAPTDDGTKLKWSAVTMPTSNGTRSGTAIAALERITMPAKVHEEIARRVWTGASLVISDEGISNETGKGTDFVVLTK